jgi:hypothetical protein
MSENKPVLEFIPAPKEWKKVEYSFKNLAEAINNRFSGITSGKEVEMDKEDFEYLRAGHDLGNAMYGRLMQAIEDHGVIRVRMIKEK